MEDNPSLYYDINGKPMDAQSYKLARRQDTIIARKLYFFGRVEIITEWTGFDLSFLPGSQPQIFETRVRVKDHIATVERYATIDEALEGHNHWAALYRQPAVIVKSFVPAID
jgi:hypothetical protein